MHEPNTESESIMKTEIVKAVNAGINVSRLGIQFEGDVAEQAIKDLLSDAGRVTRGCMFIIGDAINYAGEKWGEKYDQWVALSGLEYQTLMNASSTARKVQFYLRRENLTFEHHKIIASLAPEDQKRWLDVAETESMSVRRFRKSLLLGRPATDEDMEAGSAAGIENIHPYVNRLCGFWGKLKRTGWVANAGPEKLRSIKIGLQSVVDIYNEIPDYPPTSSISANEP